MTQMYLEKSKTDGFKLAVRNAKLGPISASVYCFWIVPAFVVDSTGVLVFTRTCAS